MIYSGIWARDTPPNVLALMGIKIAKMFDIPVINMHNDCWKQRIGDLV